MRRVLQRRPKGLIRTLINTVWPGHAPGRTSRIAGKLRGYLPLALILATFAGSDAVAKPLSAAAFNLADYKGKVVYLDFWASWCGPCRFSFPYMENLDRIYGGHGDFVVIADDLDTSRASASAFLKSVDVNFPIIYDPKGVLATRFNVGAMPTTVLIGRDGKVRFVHKGFYESREASYTSHVEELINQKR